MLVERVRAADVEMAQAPESKEVPCPYHFFCRPVIEPAQAAGGAAPQAAVVVVARLFCVDVNQGEHKTLNFKKADDLVSQSAAGAGSGPPLSLIEFRLPGDPKAYPCSCNMPFATVPTVSLCL